MAEERHRERARRREGGRCILHAPRRAGLKKRRQVRHVLVKAPPLRTWLAGIMGVKYVLGSQEAISEAGRLGGCRL